MKHISATLLLLGLCGAVCAAEPALHCDMEADDPGWRNIKDGTETLPSVNARTTDEHHSGKSSRHGVITRKISRSWPSILSPNYATETGKTYEVRFWYKVVDGALRFVVRNGADNNNLTAKPDGMLLPRFEMMGKHLMWTEYVGTYVETAGGKGAYLRFLMGSSNRVEFYLDDISVREVDVSVESALAQWREHFPNQKYVAWHKSPWDPLNKVQFPPKSPQQCNDLQVTMGCNEYESASFVVTNLDEKETKVTVNVKSPQVSVALRHAVWVTDADQASVNDALPLLEKPLTIPPGESREIWLTVRTTDQKPGAYPATVDLAFPDKKHSIALNIAIKPVTLPDDKPLYTHYWDELVPKWTGREMAMALADDLKAHYANVAVAHPWPTRMQRDGKGKLKIDFTDLDQTLDAYERMNPKIIVFWLGASIYLEKQKDYFTEPWKRQFATWLKAWTAHVRERGWGYDRFAINPFDEQLGPDLVQFVKQIDPKLLIYVNATGENEKEVRDIAPYVDIWSPYLHDYLNMPPYDRNYNVKVLAKELIGKRVAPEYFWTYANTGRSNRPKAAPPYADYRLPVWQTWQQGMRGFGYWVYLSKSRWQGHKYKDGPGWAVVYLANAEDAPPGLSDKELVVPSKRWEATREGVEDYIYLYMLREAIGKARKRGAEQKAIDNAETLLSTLPAKVLADDANHALADNAKAQLIDAIVALRGVTSLSP